MGFVPRAILAGGTGFAVSVLAACGSSSGLLSTDQSSTLSDQLARVSSAVGAGQCGAAASAATGLMQAANGLPNSVDAQLRAYVIDGAVKMQQLAPAACAAAKTSSAPASSSATASTTSSKTPSSSSSSSSSSTPTSSSTSSTTSSSTSSSTTTQSSSNSSSTTTTTGTTSNSGGGGLGGGTTTQGH